MANVVDPSEFSFGSSRGTTSTVESVQCSGAEPFVSGKRVVQTSDAILNISLLLAGVVAVVCIICLTVAGSQLHSDSKQRQFYETHRVPSLPERLLVPSGVLNDKDSH